MPSPIKNETVTFKKYKLNFTDISKADESKLNELREEIKMNRDNPLYKPPPITTILSAQEVREHERRLYEIVREVTFFKLC